MGSEPYSKDFVSAGVLNNRSRSGGATAINQEKVDEVYQTHPGSSVRSVAEGSSIPQTITYRIRTEHLLLKPYLFNSYMRQIFKIVSNAVAIIG